MLTLYIQTYKPYMKKSTKFVILAFILMIAGSVAYAQVTTSSIAGRVTDAEGPVAGAPVIATYTPSGSNYYTVTDADGSYRINAVIPGGPYTVTVDMLGYRKVETTGIYATLGDVVTVNSVLEVERMGLDAAVFIADANNTSMTRPGAGTSISQRTMQNLPTTSRQLNDVLRLTPQAVVTSDGLAIGGGNFRSSYVTVDGAAFNNAFGIGQNLPAGGAPISMDALEQLSVNITPYDVRQSGFTGGAINAVTKSGSNEWHASVYNYYRSNYVTGYKVAGEDITKTEFLNNTTGITLGGPIVKNKLFFFVNFEYAPGSVPGTTYRVRNDASEEISNDVHRPTVAFMDEVVKYLDETYGYNPGAYQNYKVATPSWKVLARVDWNINDNHRFNVRYSQTMNNAASAPSNSVNPIVPNPYNRTDYGRTSKYAGYFQSNRYLTGQNFYSLAGELNSRFLGGAVTNLFRVTWSHQDESRSFYGDNFPTVDILGDTVDGNKSVITSFGPDPFTFGNVRDVQTVIATDEVGIRFGIHNVTLGAQFEWNDTKNGFMQGGLGYYVYDSWDDFKAAGKPTAFAITHSNRDDLKQVFPSFQYMQASWYAQDEISFSERFKLTAGLRFDLPIYPDISGNENKEFSTLGAPGNTLYGLKTSDMPMSSVAMSPRIGFNWDVFGGKYLVLRGGAGIYTGRIPFVWIVSVAGNSNSLQAQYIDTDGTGANTPNFHANLSDILNDIYGGAFKAQDLYAPTAPTIISKDLSMPTTIKTSLAADFKLPFGFRGSIEGIYNKDLTGVYLNLLGQKATGEKTYPGEPAPRPVFSSEGITNSLGSKVTPYYLYTVSDPSKLGYYYSATAKIERDFTFGLSIMAAYTRSGNKTLSDGIGDQVTSAYNTISYNVLGSSNPELGYGTYVSPNRVVASLGYRIPEGRHLASTIGVFYEGYNLGFMGTYSYTRYSYTIGADGGNWETDAEGKNIWKAKAVNGALVADGGANNLVYIPTDAELESMNFSDAANKDAYKEFLSSDPYMSTHRGQYSQRGAMAMPWINRFNVKFAQDIMFSIAGKVQTITLGVDINNIGNLFNSNWGVPKQLSSDNILTYRTNLGEYVFTAPKWVPYKNTFSTWNMMFTVRYSF